MKVYALYSSYFDGSVETYTHIIDLYMTDGDAKNAQIELERANADFTQSYYTQSYYVSEMTVK